MPRKTPPNGPSASRSGVRVKRTRRAASAGEVDPEVTRDPMCRAGEVGLGIHGFRRAIDPYGCADLSCDGDLPPIRRVAAKILDRLRGQLAGLVPGTPVRVGVPGSVLYRPKEPSVDLVTNVVKELAAAGAAVVVQADDPMAGRDLWVRCLFPPGAVRFDVVVSGSDPEAGYEIARVFKDGADGGLAVAARIDRPDKIPDPVLGFVAGCGFACVSVSAREYADLGRRSRFLDAARLVVFTDHAVIPFGIEAAT